MRRDDRRQRARAAPANGTAADATAQQGAVGAGDGAQWHVNVGDNDQRTLTLSELVDAYNAGVVTQDTFIWCDGMDDWRPLAEVEAVVAALHASANQIALGTPGRVRAAGARRIRSAGSSGPGVRAPAAPAYEPPPAYEAPAAVRRTCLRRARGRAEARRGRQARGARARSLRDERGRGAADERAGGARRPWHRPPAATG